MAACTNCQVDHIAVHWYDNFPSLRAYIESNASLAGWVQFGKPIWLTEFSLNGSATAAQQEAFMREAIPYLESQPERVPLLVVQRQTQNTRTRRLINSDGTPTTLGQVYISLASDCRSPASSPAAGYDSAIDPVAMKTWRPLPALDGVWSAERVLDGVPLRSLAIRLANGRWQSTARSAASRAKDGASWRSSDRRRS